MELVYNKDNKTLFVNGVAFTKERLELIRKIVRYGKRNDPMFEYRVTVIDRGSHAEVIIDENSIGIIYKEISDSEFKEMFAFDKTNI
jgi:hypothetical protein